MTDDTDQPEGAIDESDPLWVASQLLTMAGERMNEQYDANVGAETPARLLIEYAAAHAVFAQADALRRHNALLAQLVRVTAMSGQAVAGLPAAMVAALGQGPADGGKLVVARAVVPGG